MVRSISVATGNAVSSSFTRPGYLVYIGWSTPIRLCTRDTLVCMGHTWYGGGYARISKLSSSGNSLTGGTIELTNSDLTYGTMALLEGVTDIPIKIWSFDKAATADDDPVAIFDGVGDSCAVDESRVSIQLASARSKVLMAPRSFITREAGFSILPATGQTVTWGGEKYTFERRK